MLDYFLTTVPQFFAYFGAAIALSAGFMALYALCTPHREFALVRAGNVAAALQLVGTFLGFAAPLAMIIAHAVSIPDMLAWGVVAALVQLAVFAVIARLLFPAISQRIEQGCTASGLFLGGMGLGVGILQAACMVP